MMVTKPWMRSLNVRDEANPGFKNPFKDQNAVGNKTSKESLRGKGLRCGVLKSSSEKESKANKRIGPSVKLRAYGKVGNTAKQSQIA
jgi:hypothetical protein